MFNDMKKHIEEFVSINNQYVDIKVQEEKAKVSLLFYYFYVLVC